MGCGCGGKKVTRPGQVVQSTVPRPVGTQVEQAQVYQSGTMRTAPQSPQIQRRVV